MGRVETRGRAPICGSFFDEDNEVIVFRYRPEAWNQNGARTQVRCPCVASIHCRR
jgi:hypothetical protein